MKGYFVLLMCIKFTPFLFLAACAKIDVYGNGILVDRSFGLPIYSFSAPPGEVVYFRTAGVGLITAPTGVSLGYVDQIFAAVPEGSCVAIFFVDDLIASQKIIDYLREQKVSLDKICIIRP